MGAVGEVEARLGEESTMNETTGTGLESPSSTIIYVPDSFICTRTAMEPADVAGEQDHARGRESPEEARVPEKYVLFIHGAGTAARRGSPGDEDPGQPGVSYNAQVVARCYGGTMRPRGVFTPGLDALSLPMESSRHPIATAAQGVERPRFPAEEAESQYQALGDWKGPKADRLAARRYWLSQGLDGAYWLVKRLRDETDVETLHAAASLLADLGEVGVGPIIEELGESEVADQCLALLKALAWLGESDAHPILVGAQAELILAHRLQENDPDLREAAAAAMRLLRPERAVRWLVPRLRDESDERVRRVIQEELDDHGVLRT
jgi:hypothetical protein